MKIKEWFLFVLLGLIWGSSFMWIKIAVEDIGPFSLVAFRVFFALIGLIVAVVATNQKLVFNRVIVMKYLFMGGINIVLPFLLISWGETRIPSGLASILNGTMPLFTIIIAHYWLHDEKITWMRVFGLVVGFIGVVVLLSKDLTPEGLHTDIIGQLAVIAAAIAYATATTFSRRHLRGESPVIQSTLMTIFANLLIWPISFTAQSPFRLPSNLYTWVALIWLGLLGSCIAYLIFFYLINTWGATRSSLVTYVSPIVGITLGIIFLNETLDWRIVLGTLLILSGIILVNFVTKNGKKT